MDLLDRYIKKCFGFFIFSFLVLCFIGSQSPIYPFLEVGMLSTNLYFFIFIFIPVAAFLECNFFFTLDKRSVK